MTARRRWTTGLALIVVMLMTACGAQGTSIAGGQSRPVAATAVPAAAPAGQVVRTAVARPAAVASRAQSPAPRASASSHAAAAVSPVSASLAAGTRLVTFVNRVHQTIWVAASPDQGQPLAATGWVLPVGGSVTITVPNHWNGRFWGRTGCVFHNGIGHCQTGDCGGRFQCTGWGTIPATLAEYDMDAWDNLDFYDVSMVDGSNLPMYINITKGGSPDKISPNGCVPAGCTKNVVCPSVLQIKVGSTVVACESACAKLGTEQYCCRGPWAPRSACNPAKWPVDYAAVFKRAEPYAYSYVDDDATSVFTCKGVCDYRITFGITP